MSVETLCARIATLDNEIKLQRELLKKLKSEKSCVQYELNMIQDPISRLPLELSSQIFLHAVGGFAKPGPLHAPVLILRVCNSWRDIALATPELWSAVHIAFPCAEGKKKAVKTWLDRARPRPLSVILDGVFDHDVVDLVWKRARQLEHLEIWLAEELSDSEFEYDANDNDEVILWRDDNAPRRLSSLKTLKFTDRHVESDPIPVSLAHIVELLRLAPKLTECVFDVQELGRSDYSDIFEDEEKLVLPNVRRLLFGDPACEEGFGGDDGIFPYLSVPKLEALSISLHTIAASDLLSFLTQHSPPLKELTLGDPKATKAVTLRKCLRAAPKLRRFEAWLLPFTAISLFKSLAKSPSLLRHLTTLIIHFRSLRGARIYQSLWTTILDALTARRTQLQVFRLELPDSDGPPDAHLPAADTVAALRTLADSGMHIHITGVLESRVLAHH
ncbi:F-box domain-containing protein [Favolaschia claudopus]|uniref:F-box domain-containing protein n=1 Tax=Favolaschia claudopus TaxID=2862362 RepID=A0AAW0BRL9_9AGAR